MLDFNLYYAQTAAEAQRRDAGADAPRRRLLSKRIFQLPSRRPGRGAR